MLHSLSLRARLWLLGLVSVIGIAVLALSSISHAYQSKKTLLDFVDQKIALSRTASAAYAQGLQMGQALRNILLDPANKKAYSNFDVANESFNKETDKLISLIAKSAGGNEIATCKIILSYGSLFRNRSWSLLKIARDPNQ